MRIKILFIASIVSTSYAFAEEKKSFFDNPKKGWFWDDGTVPEVKEKQDDRKIPDQSLPVVPLTPTQIIEKQRVEWESARDRAIVSGQEEDAEDYLRKTKGVVEQAERFGLAYQKVLWKNPELDPSAQNPTDFNSLRIGSLNSDAERKKKLGEISRKFGLVYFYKGDCQYCQTFSPILKVVREESNFAMSAFTLNGLTLPSFPDSLVNNDLARRYKVDKVPALYIVDPISDRHHLVLSGSTSYEKTMDKIIFAAELLDKNQSLSK